MTTGSSRRMAGWVGFVVLGLSAGCNWYVTEAFRFEILDRDKDGFAAWQVGGLDCDDAVPSIHPNAAEICGDERDNNCDGHVDNVGVGNISWFLDSDGDGFGGDSPVRMACPDALLGTTWSATSGDCDDGRPEVNPSEPEVCGDSLDNDCDGAVDDEADDSWSDLDGDGYGDPDSPASCDTNVRPVRNNLDCDDTNSDVYLGALEICDGIDNDCNKLVDDAGMAATVDGTLNVPVLSEAFDHAMQDVRICAGQHSLGPTLIRPFAHLNVVGLGRDLTVLTSDGSGDYLLAVAPEGSLSISGLSISNVDVGPAIVAEEASDLSVIDVLFDLSSVGVSAKGPDGTRWIQDSDFVGTSPGIIAEGGAHVSTTNGSFVDNTLAGVSLFESSFDSTGTVWDNGDVADIRVAVDNPQGPLPWWLRFYYEGVVDVTCHSEGCFP